MFSGNQWHITSKEADGEIIKRHFYLTELEWGSKKLPDRAFHVAYENDEAVVYHRSSKEG